MMRKLALPKMPLRFITLLMVVAAVWVLAVLVAPAQAPRAGVAATVDRPGHNMLDGVDRTDVREIDLEGLKKILQRDPKDTRPLLINFWATWCDGCREEFPNLVKIDNDYRKQGLNFISVTLDEITDIKTRVPDFLKEMQAQMPVGLLTV